MVPVPTTPTVRMSCLSSGRSSVEGVLSSWTDDRAVGPLVGVEAAAGLATQQAGGDHLLEDRGRRVQAVAALAVHRLEDLVRRVETDQVEQRQRAHRVAAAEAHGRVDVLAGGVLALVHRHRVVEVAEEQRVGDEAGLVAAHDRVLAEAAQQVLDVGQHGGLGDDGAHDLDEVLHGCGVEEVHPHHPAGAGVGRGDLGHGQRRGVGGQDRVGPHDVVEASEEALLDLQRLHDGLDHEVGVREGGEVGGEADVAQDLGLLLLAHLAAGDRTTRSSAPGAHARGRRPRRSARPRSR